MYWYTYATLNQMRKWENRLMYQWEFSVLSGEAYLWLCVHALYIHTHMCIHRISLSKYISMCIYVYMCMSFSSKTFSWQWIIKNKKYLLSKEVVKLLLLSLSWVILNTTLTNIMNFYVLILVSKNSKSKTSIYNTTLFIEMQNYVCIY